MIGTSPHNEKGLLSRLAQSPGLYFDVFWGASRRFLFSLVFIAILCAKVLHIFSHFDSLPLKRFLIWSPTFFLQDAICILVARGLTRNFHRKWARVLAASIVIPGSLGISCMAAANLSFYVTTGAEIHWRQAHYFHRDAASIKTLLTGLTGLLIIEVVFLVASWFATPMLYTGVGKVMRIVGSSAASICCRWRRKSSLPDPEIYKQVALDDPDDHSDLDSDTLVDGTEQSTQGNHSLLKQLLVLLPAIATILLSFIRPSDPAYWFLSQTLLLTPFGGSNANDGNPLLELSGLPGDYSWLGNRTALATPPNFDWLSKDLGGFRDWNKQESHVHYHPAQDPLHISNLENEVIEPLRQALSSGDVKIKHVFLFKMESTREDVVPLRNSSNTYNIVQDSYSHGQVPDDVQGRLANLTRTAERLTGTPSGFGKTGDTPKPYGGIHATNSYTAGTFTLKSVTGTVCGVSPLVADFNVEYLHHIYQPCLPHVLNAMNEGPSATGKKDDFTSWPWHSTFMQSITDFYDNQNFLTPIMGYKDKVAESTIDNDGRGEESEKMNFWGYPDTKLGSYFRDAITKAEQDNERLFITHMTGLTHHPWDMPNDEFEELVGSTWSPHMKKLNRYLNTVGYADRWYGEVLKILEETGVANETLLVMTGDHGISLPEDSGVTPYDNPHVSNFHVPLVFAHPHLPPIKVDSPVFSTQILPTILDLLSESSSLDDHSTHIVKDLLPMYEGQSMIRPIISEVDGKQNWQFSVMNTGGTWLAVRSAAKPYRLVIPLVPDVEWSFSDISIDPHELEHLMAFNLLSLLDQVEGQHGKDAVQWMIDAAHVAQWWLQDNWRRYEYSP